jgi:hypothetical protein
VSAVAVGDGGPVGYGAIEVLSGRQPPERRVVETLGDDGEARRGAGGGLGQELPEVLEVRASISEVPATRAA